MNPDPAAPNAGITASVVIPRSTVTRPDDPSRYIRTYAKDVAQLTGTQPVPPSATTEGEVKIVDPPKTRVNFVPKAVPKEEVVVSDVFTHSDVSAKEGVGSLVDDLKLPILSTSKEDEDIFVSKKEVPVYIPPQALPPPIRPIAPVQVPVPIVTVPAPASLPAIPATVTKTTPDTEQVYKEGILARLRAKAKEIHKPVPVEKPVLALKKMPLPTLPPFPEKHREINLLRTQASLVNDTYKPDSEEPAFMHDVKIPTPSTSVAPLKPPAPLYKAPAPAPIPIPAVPPPISIPVSIPAPVQQPKPVPLPEPVIPAITPSLVIPVKEESTSPLHTYSSDFADHIDERKATTFSVLAAQQDSASPTPLPKREVRSRSGLKVFAAVMIILVGIGLAGGAFFLYTQKNATPFTTVRPPSLIPFDESIEVQGSGSDLQANLAAKANQVLLSNNILLTYVTESTTTAQGTNKVPQPGGALISRLNLNAPDILLRNIDPSSSVGIIQAGEQTAPFFIMRVSSYERTFAGMLAWEPTIVNNLGILYPVYPQPITAAPTIATTTFASSTLLAPAPSIAPVFTPGFVDEVISNRNVREYRDAQGRVILLYGYVDKQTLIIARDAAAFSTLVSRIPSGAVE